MVFAVKQLKYLTLIVWLCVFAHGCSQNNSESNWSTDADVLVDSILTIHPNPYRQISPDQWQDVRRQFNQNSQNLSEVQAVLEMYKILAFAADGHTEEAFTPPVLRGRWLPLILRRFTDGWFIRTGDRRYRDLFGKPIIYIEGISIEEVVKRIKPLVSCDNDIGSLDGIGNLMRNVTILEALEIVQDDSVAISVRNEEGKNETVSVKATSDSWVTEDWIDVDQELNPEEKPLYRRFGDNYDFEYLNRDRILYVWFETIRDDGDETIAEFFDRVYRFAEQNAVDRFILDLRENSGGNLDLNGPVLHGLIRSKKINRSGRLFVIIGRDTYSAAMNLAILLEKHTYAIFVGEPTGATPNHFGDTKEFLLPQSQLTVEISELYWQNSDPRDNRPWLTPDIPIHLSFADFVQHRDPALDAIRNFKSSDPLVKDFGPTLQRWRRSNQQKTQVWPELGLPIIP